MNATLDDIAEMHNAGLVFMESAKKTFPERNGARNRDGSLMGWSIPKFHAILHIARDRLMYGWSENVSTQGGESAHKVPSSFSRRFVHLSPLLVHVILMSHYHICSDKHQGCTKVFKHERKVALFN